MFPISIHFLSHIVWPMGSTYVYTHCKGGAKGKHETKHASILGMGSIFRLLCQGVPHVPKKLVMGQSNGSFWKEKNNYGHTPSLINQSMNKYTQS